MATVIKTVCVSPVCTNYIKTCNYSTLVLRGLLLPDRSVTITINGIVNTTVLPGTGTIFQFIIWLNSLGLGFFTYSLSGSNCTIQVFGNANYGNIVIGSDPLDLTTLTPTCTTLTTPPCDLCLPQPEPEAPVVLNTRFVKPGFTTPFCSPEYTERVNCNYGDQMYNVMLSARYGLTVCCDESFDKWLIKKELLDLDSIRNTEFNCCPPVPVCDTCNSQACNCPIVYPDCYCWSFYLGGGCLVQTTCNGITETKPYAGGLHYVCSEVKPATDPSCRQMLDPIYIGPCSDETSCVTPPCICYQLDIDARAATISYTDCEGNPATTPGQFGNDNYVCSITVPTVNNTYTLTVLPNDCALGECTAPITP